ncbi:MAG TPA: hypothetical protein DD434_11070, partial [Bacteroidales bacterium]|nr:hypothetical protein [Bacteroidales bacterium]
TTKQLNKQKTMNENKETEKIASIKSEAKITIDDIINRIVQETNIPEKDVRVVIEEIDKVLRS